ncbi:hypothetical protein V2G26_017683 [Clonostachys chloroleuca]
MSSTKPASGKGASPFRIRFRPKVCRSHAVPPIQEAEERSKQNGSTPVSQGLGWSVTLHVRAKPQRVPTYALWYDKSIASYPTDGLTLKGCEEINLLSRRTFYFIKTHWRGYKRLLGDAYCIDSWYYKEINPSPQPQEIRLHLGLVKSVKSNNLKGSEMVSFVSQTGNPFHSPRPFVRLLIHP